MKRFFVPLISLFFLIAILPLHSQVSQTRFPLIGTEFGLFRMTDEGAVKLWTEAPVKKILKMPDGNSPRYFLLTDKGIFSTDDLITFTEKNSGLPFLTIKEYDGKQKTFVKQIQMLKDLEFDPLNPNVLVTTTRSEVFISKDSGTTWKSLGFSSKTMGAKAVAVCSLEKPLINLPENHSGEIEKETVVFLSHSINGISYIKPDEKKPKWTEMNEGFYVFNTMKSPEEISDIVPVIEKDVYGNQKTEIYMTQSFLGRLFRLNWEHLCAEVIWEADDKNIAFDSLAPMPVENGSLLFFIRTDGFSRFDTRTKEMSNQPAISYLWKKYISKADYHPSCALFYSGMTGTGATECLSFSELWMLYPDTLNTRYSTQIDGIKSIYAPINQAANSTKLDGFIKTVKDNNLNSMVLDMKDDFGLLHYDTKDELVIKKGKQSSYSITTEEFVKKMKGQGIHLIARIVVFKDKNLASYGNCKYAVVDSKTGAPWKGVKRYAKADDSASSGTEGKSETEYYDEQWVDPYSEEVWEYNVAIAKELISRGFDEIQFDYIRFPTDGLNLAQARYRWKEKSMDMESALVSFLSYARKNVDAPIGIDIYGANGWYRSGTRTGQDVELMAPYVDIICPMFYPSHFEQSFMAYEPAEDRPYRIYYYGTFRNSVIGRNQVLVRPWAQAFYLNVSYDKKYYDKNYVRRQIFGVRDSTNNSYMFWNNSGRYSDITPDPTKDEVFEVVK